MGQFAHTNWCEMYEQIGERTNNVSLKLKVVIKCKIVYVCLRVRLRDID